MKTKPIPGTRVKWTTKFRQSTGIKAQTFVVIDCQCGLCIGGNHVAVDDRHRDFGTRHIAFDNVQEVK